MNNENITVLTYNNNTLIKLTIKKKKPFYNIKMVL